MARIMIYKIMYGYGEALFNNFSSTAVYIIARNPMVSCVTSMLGITVKRCTNIGVVQSPKIVFKVKLVHFWLHYQLMLL